MLQARSKSFVAWEQSFMWKESLCPVEVLGD